jgi:drug/metabolite transporter (DMT)-like permease
VWAALFGAIVLNEKLNGWGYFGAGIIIAGCLLTQLQINGHQDPTAEE